MAAAAGWDLGPGADPRLDPRLVTKTLDALGDLSTAIPSLAARLQSKDVLDEHQRALSQRRGSVETTGGMGEDAKFHVDERIGEGTFCVVFGGELKGTAADGHGTQVAIKFELRQTDSTQLRNEYRMYKKMENARGIPKIYSFGDVYFHKVLIMDLLGPSLETLFLGCNRKFSVKTVAMLAKQMISRIQSVHECGLIYRDIKPENFLIGAPNTDDTSIIYLVDYGMAKVYRDPVTNQHIPYGEAQSLSGTARYMSINAHCRRSQSRRDDLEALGHVFMYFLRGNLPWQGIKPGPSDQRHDRMCEKKQATSIEDLCHEFPPEFAEYLSYARGLTFDGDPDYAFLRGLFDRVLSNIGATDDGLYCWLMPRASTQSVDDKASLEPAGKELLRPVSPPPATALDTPAPASPPGKRRRSEFESTLRPPIRVRSKKTAFPYYDGPAQLALVTLYRDIMAKRYAFHRATSGMNRATPSAASVKTATMAANVSSGRAAASGTSPRFRNPLRGTPKTLLSPAFSETLDKSLSAINLELEDMSDKLLQGGDWTGMARAKTLFDRLSEAIERESERLRHVLQASQEAIEAASSHMQQSPVRDTMKGRGREGGNPVDVNDLVREGQGEPTATAGGLLLSAGIARDGTIYPRSIKARSRTREGPAAAASDTAMATTDAEHKIDDLSLQAAQTLQADDAAGKIEADDGDDDDDDGAFALVYRTASGTQKVLRVASDKPAK